MYQADERVDYLPGSELKIIQSPHFFNFSLDAVLLARFAYVPIQKGRLVDLCTGTGAVPLLLSERTKGDLTAVDIQEPLVEMAKRSVKLNHLDKRIDVIDADVKSITSRLGHGGFDIVTCNPPYFPVSAQANHNENDHLTIARHEVSCTLDDVTRAAAQLLRAGGKFAMVHRPERLVEILLSMKEMRLEPKRMQFVYPRMGKEANTLLIEGIKNGKPGLVTLPPLYIYEGEEYTREARQQIYGC
ncbi:tRNA1(Val) (adenine(37)-N6)-methyltransferase [Bacillaceae bacterium SIJ1]|uniref:tRNA1(Val) (adenine(37)-N6)-methyltransferase n=1 Tax=Litoribacterium kuwaitense TaxID=1398745 RepID=UPI0013E9C133|nr:tRNA1(Val) (adenine(37)-N6)-methyltransferase [Litoribacterium kuwaitense]NGP45785.1 tRNA1(Val) (adenine(37)-N6)-methyltransferase [Litoribacterium kuwaitense]